MERRWGSCRAWLFKKSRASALERQVSVRSDDTKQQLGLGHNLGTHKSSFDLNRTWDGTSMGIVQGLALQKERRLRPGEASICQVGCHETSGRTWTQLGRTKQQLGLE
jgi:hypothetical protein